LSGTRARHLQLLSVAASLHPMMRGFENTPQKNYLFQFINYIFLLDKITQHGRSV